MGLPVSGDSLAFLTASWNFFSSRSEECFCASTDCRKMESRRLSCSFMARAASSMSANILGLTAAVWAITPWISASTLRTALQQGQVTSNGGTFFGMTESYPKTLAVVLEVDGENVEQGRHPP